MYLDLSVPISEKTPVYPGDPAIQIAAAGDLDRDGYNDHVLTFGTHIGTHIDAPAHMIAGGNTLDAYPVARFFGRGRYISVPNNNFSIADVKQADVAKGDIVLFHTGMSDLYHNPKYFKDYPELPAEIAEYLVARQVSIVGFDMCSPDHEPFPAHKILLGGDVLIIENLTGLGELALKNFSISALPMNLALDGGPVRVVAHIQD